MVISRPRPGPVLRNGSRSHRATSIAMRASSTSARSFTKGRSKWTKTEASRRAVPLQAIALDAIERRPSRLDGPLLFPSDFGMDEARSREVASVDEVAAERAAFRQKARVNQHDAGVETEACSAQLCARQETVQSRARRRCCA